MGITLQLCQFSLQLVTLEYGFYTVALGCSVVDVAATEAANYEY
jgi:hypothetical protein